MKRRFDADRRGVRWAWQGATGLLALVAVTGCGGVVQRDVEAPAPARAGIKTAPAAARGVVRIERVENVTGRAECDDLAHYIHLKAAQTLEANGWAVLGDELLAQADFLELGRAGATEHARAADRSLRIEIARAVEQADATLSVAVFSTQRQSAAVTLRLHWRDEDTGAERTLERAGVSAKGAWGVLAKVDREALLRREGFWQVDRSLLGGAAADALRKAISSPFP